MTKRRKGSALPAGPTRGTVERRPRRVYVEVSFVVERDKLVSSEKLQDAFRAAVDAVLAPGESYYHGHLRTRWATR